MIVTTLHYGHRPDDLAMVRNLMRSAMRYIKPPLTIIEQTDMEYSPQPLRMRLMRGLDTTFSEFRVKHEINACGQFPEHLSVDIDCEFTADVSEVWAQDFDIALTERPLSDPMRAGILPGGETHAIKWSGERWVGGVHFNRNPGSTRFWEQVQRMLSNFPDPFYGIQQAQNYVAQYGGFKVLSLPERIYNRRPDTPEDRNGKILHYRGDTRKKWLMDRLNANV